MGWSIPTFMIEKAVIGSAAESLRTRSIAVAAALPTSVKSALSLPAADWR